MVWTMGITSLEIDNGNNFRQMDNGNNFNHWKFSDFVVDLNYFYFSYPNPNPNPTHLTKHDFLSPIDISVFGM